MNTKRYRFILKRLPFLVFLCLMLLFPTATLTGASSGLLLWFQKILPVLLPFVIISGLIIRLGLIMPITKLLYPVFKLFFPVSPNGCYPIFLGFLSGLPMGAKTVADLMEQKKISPQEGRYLVCLCNNASPMFLLNYIAASELGMPELGLPLCIILYLSSILSSRLACSPKRFTTSQQYTAVHAAELDEKPSACSLFAQLDHAILDGFTVVTKIGGYVILFSILSSYFMLLPLSALIRAIFICILEITTGVHQMSLVSLSLPTKFFFITIFTAFGGLSGLAQTQSVIASSGLSIGSYFRAKLINAIFAAFISILYLLFFWS